MCRCCERIRKLWTTEEATFCQRLKSRAKKRIPEIDLLIATTNQGDGCLQVGEATSL